MRRPAAWPSALIALVAASTIPASAQVGGKPVINRWRDLSDIPASTEQSLALSKELKRRGMSFVGPIGIYAFMQSEGMVLDHTLDCFRRSEVQVAG